MEQSWDALVIGAGINGLCTAWNLLCQGVPRVAVLEQHPLFHEHGSSHGRSRITRSAYGDPVYVQLMQIAHGEDWPRLEAECGERLIHRRDGCFFGPRDGHWREHLAALGASGVDVVELDVAEARRRFPGFRFAGEDLGVLWDRTAGLVAAADTLSALARCVRRRGGQIFDGLAVLSIEPQGEAVTVRTVDGALSAPRVVVTAGAWAGRLVPRLAPALTVLRQTVVYAEINHDPATFPVWAWLGHGPGDWVYGLPAFQRPGLKAARHRVAGVGDDPDVVDEPGQTDDVLRFLGDQLDGGVRRVIATERCLYTCTDDEDFVIDQHPELPGVILGAGFSGHGFKFGPLTGRILAELALHGQSTVAPFEANRAKFGVPR